MCKNRARWNAVFLETFSVFSGRQPMLNCPFKPSPQIQLAGRLRRLPLDSSLSPCSSSCESLELHRAGYVAPDHDA